MDGYTNYMKVSARGLKKKGTGYSLLYSDAVSAEGRCCLERLNFTSIHTFGDEGELYKGDKQSVVNAIAGRATQAN